jgi:secreted PhoX family phosphatase
MAVDRRTFLKGSAAAAAGVAMGGPFQAFLARAGASSGGWHGGPIDPPPLVPTADLRDNVLRLALPAGFQYRSFDPTGAPMVGGTVPGNHDGMAAFAASGGKVRLIRNHERNGSLGAFTTSVPFYDSAAPGGNTSVLVDLEGRVTETHAVLAGTQMNCAGGETPWGSWISCEETVNGPDVFDDFTRNIPEPSPAGELTYIQNKRLTKTHGYLFEVPTAGAASAQPITRAGRFSHEAAAFDSRTGSLYLTEDNFGFGSGFYRYDPPVDPRRVRKVLDGGKLWMLAVVGKPQANLSGNQQRGRRYKVRWVRITNPNPQFPMVPDPDSPGSMKPTTTNNQAISNVGRQGYDAGGAIFSRLEGIVNDDGVIYFTSTQGGGDPEIVDWVNSAEGRGGFGRGLGQVWAYHPKQLLLEVIYQSTSTDDLHLPDNVTVSRRGTLVICEDNAPPVPTDGNKLQALTTRGQLITIADHLERPGVEWAGATFSPGDTTLYVNLNTGAAMSIAIWGPWETVGV